MAKEESNFKIILILPEFGKFRWWPGLQLIDFVPKGKIRYRKTYLLLEKQNNYYGALKAVLRIIEKDIKLEKEKEKEKENS